MFAYVYVDLLSFVAKAVVGLVWFGLEGFLLLFFVVVVVLGGVGVCLLLLLLLSL